MGNQQPYMPADLARVTPDVHTKPFWDYCRQHELRIQRCTACGKFRNPPLPGCLACGSFDVEWVKVSGKGTVYSFTIPHHPVVPVLAEYVPYNVVVVELEGTGGVRLISNLIDMPYEDISIGQAVELVWEDISDDVALPRFKSAA